MASEQGGPSAPALGANLSESASIPILSTAAQPNPDLTRSKSLKRSRPDSSQGPAPLTSIANAGLDISPSAKSPRFKNQFSPGFPPVELTGAAAIAEQRQKQEERQRSQSRAMSENPRHQALSSLIAGGGAGMSSPQDAPLAATEMSEGMSAVANTISIPSPMQVIGNSETSPASVTSLASLGTTAATATAGSTMVASPTSMTSAMEAESRELRNDNTNQLQLPSEEQPSNKALSYPGNVLGQRIPSRQPPRGTSLPMIGQAQQLAPRSPSQKKHKCPYCETDFTRHHNLKSHLLTHSQEKPYVCQTCTMRFRRLHDLKRHMKLHTGERPHICPKCDRKFARGDALARHSKGQGGCAGRRASMDGFGGDVDFEGSNGDADEGAMDGIMYSNGTPHPNESEMTEEERRRYSLPSIKAQHVGSNHGTGDKYTAHSRTPSTYPPSGPRPGQQPTSGLYPPNADRAGSSSSGTSTSMQNSMTGGQTPTASMSSLPSGTGGAIIYPQSGITESPKPLSPAGMHSHQLGQDPAAMSRQRSPSLTTQFQQQHFGRRPSGISPPPGSSLPSPHSTLHGPKLPALAGLAPPDQRYTLSSQTPNQQTPPNGTLGGQGSSTGFSRGVPGGNNDSSANLFAAGDGQIYVRTLEDKVKQLSEKVQFLESKDRSQEETIKSQAATIKRFSEELIAVKNQLNLNTQQQSQGMAPL